MLDVISFAKDTDKLQGYGCIGYAEISYGPADIFNVKLKGGKRCEYLLCVLQN